MDFDLFDEYSTYYMAPRLSEVVDAFSSMTYPDYAVGLSLSLTAALLFVPISNIDRRDSVVGFAYMAFIAFAGVMLVMAIPRRFTGSSDFGVHVMLVMALMTVSGARWSLGARRKRKEI